MSKYLCLSFDDGPNIIPGDTTMNDMLDIMEKHNVPGSFFLIGNKITEENKKIIMRAVKMGCDIQNHSWTHSFMSKMTPEQIREEYKKCDDVITELVGVRPTFFRPPYVDLSQTMYDNISVPFICGRGVADWEPDKDADYRYEHMLPFVLTTNLTEEQLGNYLGGAVYSRICEMCNAVMTSGKDHRRA